MSLFKEIEQKPLEYLVLFFIFISAAVLLILNPSHVSQRDIVYVTSAAYFLWSLYHHYRRGDLHLSIIIEYLVFILLVIVITASSLL